MCDNVIYYDIRELRLVYLKVNIYNKIYEVD